MQRLSSPSTFFYKRVLPVFWLGFLVVFALVWLGGGVRAEEPGQWLGLAMPVFLCIVGGLVFKRLILGLADEVWLEGDVLVVKSRGDSTRLPLRDVINVNSITMTNPPRITLMLRTESAKLGPEVSFIPAGARGLFSVFRPNPVAVDLIRRIDALRRRPE